MLDCDVCDKWLEKVAASEIRASNASIFSVNYFS